jgi:TolB-like protein/DNA-binding winged helix-turn-helix (wHTH) protein/Flp pilus assembly protein TadD
VPVSPPQSVIRFGIFELDLKAGVLSRNGSKLPLPQQPLQLLAVLLERPGEIVTREELRLRLWASDVFVDFDHGLNKSVQKLRDALCDSATSPRYIQTIPRVGYSFIAPVRHGIRPLEAEPELEIPRKAPESSETVDQAPETKTVSGRWGWIGLASLVLILIASIAVSVGGRRSLPRRIHSVTVLPLQNLSHDPNTEYFADGMTEELTTELSAIPELQVVSDSSLTPVKNGPESPREIARKLSVDAIIQGSVSHSKDKVSLDIRMFDGRSDRQLWAGRFQDTSANLPALQKHVAAEIASYAQVLLTPPEEARLDNAKPLDPSAYDGYLQGRYLLRKRDFEGAVKMFRRAVVLDPGYARSWAGLAAGLADGGQDSGPTQAPIPEAKAAARHAIELDPDNGEAWSVLGEIATNNDWDWKTAEYDLQRAIALSPSDPTTELRYANFLSIVGHPDEAVSHMRRALELEPLSFLCVRHMGSVLYWSRRYDESLEYLRKAEEMEPGLVGFTESWVIDDDEMKGLHDEAVMATLQLFSDLGLKGWQDRLNAAYRSGGRRAFLETSIKFEESLPDSGCSGYATARINVLLGENDKALEGLNRSLNARCNGLPMIRMDPIFDPLRSDPRFKNMLERLNLGG